MLGTFTNKFGPRYAQGFLLLLSSSAIFGMALVNSSAAFIVCRCIIGFSLSSFVPCQYWSSVLFTAPLVGTANAFAGGWGNLGNSPPPSFLIIQQQIGLGCSLTALCTNCGGASLIGKICIEC